MSDRNKSRIPYLLAGLIGIFVLFLSWSARQASTGGTDITDRDYYSKGLKYNSTLVEKRAASVIGWSVKADLKPDKLILILTDKEKKPVAHAIATINFPEPGSNRSRNFQLQESTPGHYLLELPANLSGEQLTRINFERNGARINRQLLLNIPGKKD